MATRRVVVFEWMSADGFFAGVDGGLQWVVPDDAQARAAAAGIDSVDTVLFGRRTYEMFASFWPGALAGADALTAADPHRPGQRSREHRIIAVALHEMTKLVFSRTLTEASWHNSRIVRELDPRQIEAMKRAPGRDMIVFGSGSIVSRLTEHRLIDEYRLVVCPVFLGRGRSLLGDLSTPATLTLLEEARYPSGDVLLRYAPAG
jgi:dihydrofolate reductase